MEIFRNQKFANRFGWAGELQKRNTFPVLEGYLDGDHPNRVCILYGLRRTGKSVMMFQAMLERQNSAYILCEKDDTLDTLSDNMDTLWEEGVRNFFIDEITILPDFIDRSQFLADVYCGYGKVVLAGTDSLSFDLAGSTSLSGRKIIIHTTHIPFQEHSRLLGTTTLDEYARHGGILTNVNEFSAYPLEAIARNIQNSLKHYEAGERFAALLPLYQKNLLTTVIQKTIKNENHHFSKEVVQSLWNLSDFTQVRNTFLDKNVLRIARQIKPAEILPDVLRILDISNEKISVSNEELYSINQFLQYLDLIDPALTLEQADLYFPPDLTQKQINNKSNKILEKLSFENRRQSPEGRWIFRQPGLRWAQVDALLKTIQKKMPNKYSKETLDVLFDAIRNNAMGYLLEDIVIGETAASFDYKIPVFKYRPLKGDIDMVIVQPDCLEIFEIKHSQRQDTTFSKHITNPENIKILEKFFNKKSTSKILYSGETTKNYVNVAEYLNSLDFSIEPTLVNQNSINMQL